MNREIGKSGMRGDEGNLRKGKPEEDLIRDYWKWRGGTLIREYEMVKKDKGLGVERRRLDAVLIRSGKREWIDKASQTFLDSRVCERMTKSNSFRQRPVL